MERIAGDMNGYEPEVALAVRVAPSGDAEPEKDSNDGDEEDDDEAEIDAFLSSNGFEFIDASETLAAEGSGPFSQGAFQLILPSCIFFNHKKSNSSLFQVFRAFRVCSMP